MRRLARFQFVITFKDGVLMRKYRSPDIPAEDEWKLYHQIVVPKLFRNHVLSLAHENPMAGHLGVNKTCERILAHFFWPTLRQDG